MLRCMLVCVCVCEYRCNIECVFKKKDLIQGGGGGLSITKTILRKNNEGTIQIKVSNSIKRTNLSLSQHPPPEFYN